MAKLKVFSPFDSKLRVWMNPMFFMHSGQAERTWMELVNDPKSILAKHPEDFTLFQIGTFDDETGVMESLSAPVQLMTAKAALKKSDQELPLHLQNVNM